MIKIVFYNLPFGVLVSTTGNATTEGKRFIIGTNMKNPAVLFYTSDFLSGTILMSNEDTGRYIKLLCLQHQIYPDHIPENHMISACLSYDNPVIKKFIKDDKGFYYNERMEQEIKKRVSFCESRSNNKSGRPSNKSYDSTYDKSHDNHMLLHMGNDNDNENKDINKNEDVEKIYLSYPTTDKNNNNRTTGKSSKDKRKIAAILKTKYPLEKAINFYVSECNRNKTYLKNFSVFLNNLPEQSYFKDFEPEKPIEEMTEEERQQKRVNDFMERMKNQ